MVEPLAIFERESRFYARPVNRGTVLVSDDGKTWGPYLNEVVEEMLGEKYLMGGGTFGRLKIRIELLAIE